jgi:hypothetical protein
MKMFWPAKSVGARILATGRVGAGRSAGHEVRGPQISVGEVNTVRGGEAGGVDPADGLDEGLADLLLLLLIPALFFERFRRFLRRRLAGRLVSHA